MKFHVLLNLKFKVASCHPPVNNILITSVLAFSAV